MEEKKNSKYYAMSDYKYEAEKQKEKDRKKKFKLVKRYKNFDLYEHKKFGFKECFYR